MEIELQSVSFVESVFFFYCVLYSVSIITVGSTAFHRVITIFIAFKTLKVKVIFWT